MGCFAICGGVASLPWKVLGPLLVLCVVIDMDRTMVFSFAPQMIKSFGTSEVETGYYAGILGAAIYIGWFCNIPWSYLGDKVGKKLSIICSSTGLALTILAFGFSYNYNWALVTRLLQSFNFGALSVSKSLLYEHLDETNMNLGMAILTSFGTVGLIIGPSMAGFLVFPAEKYPETFSKKSIFHSFPVLMPNIVLSLSLFAAILYAIVFLPGASNKNTDECNPLLQNEVEGKSLLEDEDEDEIKNAKESARPSDAVSLWKRFLGTKAFKVFKVDDCILTCFLFGMFLFSNVAFNELLPLLASTSIEYNGMGLSTSEIGTCFLVVTVFLIFVQIPVLTVTSKWLGVRRYLIYSLLLQGILIPMIPTIGLIRQKYLIMGLLGGHIFVFRLQVQGTFLSISILINNTIATELNNVANAIGFMFSAVGSVASPLVFGNIYSWSLENVQGVESNTLPLGFPFNQFFAFFVWSLFSFLLAYIATRLSKSADHDVNKTTKVTRSK